MLKRLTLISVILLAICVQALSQSKPQAGKDLSLKTLVIDAGHGGKDPGTISLDKKTSEKSLTLKISKKFAEKVRTAYPGMKVILTRKDDTFIPLDRRAKMASNAGADLFLSIHINATKNKATNGFAAYILGQSAKGRYDSYDVNLEVCKRENSVIYLEEDYSTRYKGFDDSPESQILMQLMQNAFREQSLAFAETVSDKMLDGPFDKVWDVMQGNFAVLRLASMPAVLLEFGYMSNTDDLAKLRDEDKLDKIVDILFDAFVDYKTNYDKSVRMDTANGKPADPAVSDGAVMYGVQILASSKQMDTSDKYFKGLDVIAVKSGNLYKYVAAPSEDRNETKRKYGEIKKLFPDSFFVKINGSQITREQ